jgi:sulfatase modifying factor 1
MKKTIRSLLLQFLALSLLIGAGLSSAYADTFGSGGYQFTIDFTTIGNPGNAADETGYGSVGYTYRMGTYAISLYDIAFAQLSGLDHVTAHASGMFQPATMLNWYQSAAFVNWLNTSKGFAPAYNLNWGDGYRYDNGYSMPYTWMSSDNPGTTKWRMFLWDVSDSGYDANNPYRNSQAKYFLPSENEWYKAAYGKSDGSGYYLYPNASDSPPSISFLMDVNDAGELSSYGTMGQGGTVWQWLETSWDGVNDDPRKGRALRGGSFESDTGDLMSYQRPFYPYADVSPDYDSYTIGFRVASVADLGSVPEPSTYALFGLGAIGMLIVMRRKKTA